MSPLAKWILALGLIIGMSVVTLAQAIGSDYFGLHANSGVVQAQPWPSVAFGGIRLLSSQTDWALLNPSAGVYDWTVLDKWLAAFPAHSIPASGVIYSFDQTPQWASSNPNDSSCIPTPGVCDPPNDLNADGTGTNQHWKDFVTALTAHVAGRITYWEVWNEPFYAPFFNGTPAQLTRLAKDLRAIARAADPNAKILSPPGSGYHTANACYASNAMTPWFTAGIGQYVDVVSFHSYYSIPSGTNVPENFAAQVACLRTMMTNQGQQNKPLWSSEGGWGGNTDLPDSDQQAAYVARAYLILNSLGVKRFYWFQWNNTTWGTLWASGTGLTKAGVAYREVANWMIGSTLTSPCSASGTIWTCGLTLANGHAAQAVWDTSGISAYTPPASTYTQYRDLAGGTTVLGATVNIGIKPILLETTGTSPLPPTNLTVVVR
jgi:hypothetical protein